MIKTWNTNNELTKEIITAVYQEINDQLEEMVEDIGCPRDFAGWLLKSIENNYTDGRKAGGDESSYSSRHSSTPEYERGAQEIVSKHEKIARDISSDLLKSYNKKAKVRENANTHSSLYSSRHISTQEEEKEAEEIVTKNEKMIREKWIKGAKEKKTIKNNSKQDSILGK